MNVNWSGLAGEDLQDVLTFLDDKELLGGIVGSHVDHHTAPYSLTEEFVSVYRMHPLIPDDYAFHSAVTGRLLEKRQLDEISGQMTPAIAERLTMTDLFYSFGTCHPGAVTLHNYPRHLQNLTRDDGEHLDLAAVDILRDRERGVPRYNEFRRLFHKAPVKSFDELTDNPAWRKQLNEVYNDDLEKVDLMTGLFAEPLPPGFGFSETAFRVFILMASRRLKSDRFFTDDFRPEIYTEFGIDYVRRNSMLQRPQAALPAARTVARGSEERVRAVETDRRAGGELRGGRARRNASRQRICGTIGTSLARPHCMGKARSRTPPRVAHEPVAARRPEARPDRSGRRRRSRPARGFGRVPTAIPPSCRCWRVPHVPGAVRRTIDGEIGLAVAIVVAQHGCRSATPLERRRRAVARENTAGTRRRWKDGTPRSRSGRRRRKSPGTGTSVGVPHCIAHVPAPVAALRTYQLPVRGRNTATSVLPSPS